MKYPHVSPCWGYTMLVLHNICCTLRDETALVDKEGRFIMPFFIISILLQVALVVHIVKSGRNTMWIWIVVMLPMAGSIAYLLLEVLPELMAGRAGRSVKRNIEGLVNPNKGINAAARELSISQTVENSMKLAEECMSKGMYEEARKLYKKSLKGVHDSDPVIMYGLARAEFGLRNYYQAKQQLDELIIRNPGYKNPEAHLLYARTAEALNDMELAFQEYEALDGYYPGPEATLRYALLLKKNGSHERASSLLEKIIHLSEVSGRHYNSLHKQWIVAAKTEYRS